MALDPKFPKSPYAVLNPGLRWVPGNRQLLKSEYAKLLPPLVHNLREEIKKWRDSGYEGAADTSRALLRWWFHSEYLTEIADSETSFQYYFAQREAVETVIYLHDVLKFTGASDLIRYDASGAVSTGMFEETWRRLVIKMATGSGKTKVMSLLLAWCFFHKLYEPDSDLARNFLLIAPNIIVLDRLRADFDGLRIFHTDPVLPENGFADRDWRHDFQLTLHIQDDLGIVRPTGNIFLTNIHRVYPGDDRTPSADDDNTMDYFLGPRPKGKTADSKVDLGVIVREVDELVVINDEAHHIHSEKLAWFQSIRDIHYKLLHKDKFLSMQLDVTATPRHNNGAIFVQTISDYPLVEAISQNVVKHPVIPDEASRAKLGENRSIKFTEKYRDYLHLGVEEWRKVHAVHKKMGKNAILFIMTDRNSNCDEVAEYLEDKYPVFKGAVLVIHTDSSGEIKASELNALRVKAGRIDDPASPYKAIVSVMMLREGWDVRNVTTIVGLRAYKALSNILPEQTLGRGLRRMYPDRDDVEERVSVVGTDRFMAFVESINSEGVELEQVAMGEGTEAKAPLVIEVDNENTRKNLEKLDIEIPVLTPRVYREYKNLSEISLASLTHAKVALKQFSEEEQREIVFRDVATGEISHTTRLDHLGSIEPENVIGHFTREIMRDLRLFSGYDILYGLVKEFIVDHLFDRPVDVADLNTLRNLSEDPPSRTIFNTFKDAINALTTRDRGEAEVVRTIKLRQVRPFVVKNQDFIKPGKSVFNRVVGDSELELKLAGFLEGCPDIVSYAKNNFAINFRIDYVKSDGNISVYYPDFIVKVSDSEVCIVETKGAEYLDDPRKLKRLKQWCEDANRGQDKARFDFVYVDEGNFTRYPPSNFRELLAGFREYKD